MVVLSDQIFSEKYMRRHYISELVSKHLRMSLTTVDFSKYQQNRQLSIL